MTALSASKHSLTVDIPIYKNGVVVREQDKGEALFGPLLIQFLFFLVMDVARGLRNMCSAVIGVDAFIFSIVVYNSIRLLSA